MIISKGYLECEKCGTIFTARIDELYCYKGSAKGLSPSEHCVECDHFMPYAANDGARRCPACGSNSTHRILGVHARLAHYFRK